MTPIKELDGEPHEVAREAGRRLKVVIVAAQDALSDFRWAARNAWLTAEDVRTGTMPKGEEFEDQKQAELIDGIGSDLELAERTSEVLTQAASYDPRAH